MQCNIFSKCNALFEKHQKNISTVVLSGALVAVLGLITPGVLLAQELNNMSNTTATSALRLPAGKILGPASAIRSIMKIPQEILNQKKSPSSTDALVPGQLIAGQIAGMLQASREIICTQLVAATPPTGTPANIKKLEGQLKTDDAALKNFGKAIVNDVAVLKKLDVNKFPAVSVFNYTDANLDLKQKIHEVRSLIKTDPQKALMMQQEIMASIEEIKESQIAIKDFALIANASGTVKTDVVKNVTTVLGRWVTSGEKAVAALKAKKIDTSELETKLSAVREKSHEITTLLLDKPVDKAAISSAFKELMNARQQFTTLRLQLEQKWLVPVKCQQMWWYDSDNQICSQKQFCGAYMYNGLKTFKTEVQCNASLTAPTPTSNSTAPATSASTVNSSTPVENSTANPVVPSQAENAPTL